MSISSDWIAALRSRSPVSAHDSTRASRVQRQVGARFFVVVLCPDRAPTSVRGVGAQSVVFVFAPRVKLQAAR